MGRRPTQILRRARNTSQRAFCAFQALEAEIERAAIVRLQHKQTKRCRRMLLEHFFEREEIAKRLRHLLAVHQQHARVHPRVRKALVPCARCLRAFIFMVRERKVAATAMDIDGHTQVAMHHGSAFGMPARTAFAPGAFPAGLTRLGGLPQGEVERVALDFVFLNARAHHEVVDIAAGYFAIGLVAAHREIHVAILDRIGMALLNERFDHGDHGTDFFRSARAHVGVDHVRATHDVDELVREFRGHLGSRATLLVGSIDNLVINVGQILGKRHFITACNEPAANNVKADKRASVADVDIVIHRGAAHIHAHLARLDRLEFCLFMGLGAVDLHDSSWLFRIRRNVGSDFRGASDDFALRLSCKQRFQASNTRLEFDDVGRRGVGQAFATSGGVFLFLLHELAVAHHNARGNADHGAVLRHVLDDNRAATDLRIVVNGDTAKNGCIHANHNVIAERGMALAALFARAAERDTLIQRDVIADFARFADDHAHGVVDEETTADFRSRVNFHARHETSELARNARQAFQAVVPQPMLNDVAPTSMQARIREPNDEFALRGRIETLNVVHVFSDGFKNIHDRFLRCWERIRLRKRP